MISDLIESTNYHELPRKYHFGVPSAAGEMAQLPVDYVTCQLTNHRLHRRRCTSGSPSPERPPHPNQQCRGCHAKVGRDCKNGLFLSHGGPEIYNATFWGVERPGNWATVRMPTLTAEKVWDPFYSASATLPRRTDPQRCPLLLPLW